MQDVILIDVPEGAGDFDVHLWSATDVAGERKTFLFYKDDTPAIDLPPGSWTIVEQTEEGAAKIMPKINDEDESYGWEHFMSDEEFEKHDRVDALPTALASLHSWIRSQGKEPKTSIILKKEI
jgi:hypothetical protein